VTKCEATAECLPYSGKISVPKDANLPANRQCIILDRKTLAEWQGNADVNALAIQWLAIGGDYYCDPPPKDNPVCLGKNCVFDPATLPAMTVDYCLCYKLVPTATDGTTTLADPRLIIRR
jgi:hypothetical protein